MRRNCRLILAALFISLFSISSPTLGDEPRMRHRATAPSNAAGNNREFQYDPEGKIDPFKSLFIEKRPEPVPPERYVRECPRGAVLENLDLSQLNLVAIILTGDENKALFQEASGRGHIVSVGMCVGINSAKVVNILADKIVVQEKALNAHNEVVVNRREILLKKSYEE